jgi:hypothetical protein
MAAKPVQVGAWIDATYGSTFPQSVQGNQGIFAVYNGNWYLVQGFLRQGFGGTQFVAVYKSTNGGSTWTLLDIADAPASANATSWCGFYDAPNNRFLIATSASPTSNGVISLWHFSLVTETWSAAFGVGPSQPQNGVVQVFQRPDTSIVVLYDHGNPVGAGTTRLKATVWNGVTWNTPIDVGTAILVDDSTGNILVSATIAAMDSTGVIHFVFNNATGVTYNAGVGTAITPSTAVFYYQQFLTNNSLGNSFKFTSSQNRTKIANFPASLAILGSNLCFGVSIGSGYFNAVYVGQGLSNPLWTLIVLPFNQVIGETVADSSPVVATDGNQFVVMVTTDQDLVVPTFAYFQLASSPDGLADWAILSGNQVPTYLYEMGTGSSPQLPNLNLQNSVHSISPYLFVVAGPNGNASTAYGFAFPWNSSYDTGAQGDLGAFLASQLLLPTWIEISLHGVKRNPKDECKAEPMYEVPVYKRRHRLL